jgi:hypothetical protein
VSYVTVDGDRHEIDASCWIPWPIILDRTVVATITYDDLRMRWQIADVAVDGDEIHLVSGGRYQRGGDLSGVLIFTAPFTILTVAGGKITAPSPALAGS